MKERSIQLLTTSKPVLEGAGVHLRRAFGYAEIPLFDPFLMLDDFRNDKPDHYLAGFPWHPHRGIETITYMLSGSAEHSDSLGNSGIISGGDVQWMTAGSGIIHQEMPKPDEKGRMYGFQLWANLPAKHKMMKPRYQDIRKEDIPVLHFEQGIEMKIISGHYNLTDGPVKDIIIEPQFFDISMPAHTEFLLETKHDHNCFIYVYDGEGMVASRHMTNRNLALFSEGIAIRLNTGESPLRFLFLSGKPLHEPIAWRGPIVMNTQEELLTAFDEYHKGTFIKKG